MIWRFILIFIIAVIALLMSNNYAKENDLQDIWFVKVTHYIAMVLCIVLMCAIIFRMFN